MELSLCLGDDSVQADSQALHQLVIAGWTGRDPEALERHIAELEALGVKRPSTTPIFYHVSVNRATLGTQIEVTSGAHAPSSSVGWSRRSPRAAR